MEQLGRKDIKEIFDDSIAPLVTELRAANLSHEKDLLRLSKQSAEHYENIRGLEEKVTSQIMVCQTGNNVSLEKSGIRASNMEKNIARIDQKIVDIEADITEMKTNKQFNISQWLVVAGVVVVIIFEIIPHV